MPSMPDVVTQMCMHDCYAAAYERSMTSFASWYLVKFCVLSAIVETDLPFKIRVSHIGDREDNSLLERNVS
jgi:hypothetical protein